MNLEKIQSITITLLKRESEQNENNEAEYSKKVTAKFIPPENFPKTEETFSLILKDIYDDLMLNSTQDVDSIGIWVESDSGILDNAISLRTLQDIQEYSKDKIIPIFEFFKMTILE